MSFSLDNEIAWPCALVEIAITHPSELCAGSNEDGVLELFVLYKWAESRSLNAQWL